jgi:hypothetical protein
MAAGVRGPRVKGLHSGYSRATRADTGHRGKWEALCLAALLGLLALAAPVPAIAQRTTVQNTIQDEDGDNLLEQAEGEHHLVFGAPEGFDPSEGESLVNFLQLTDFQMVDEESPARVEFLDFTQRGLFNPFSAAYRPQESLTTQVTEAMVRQAKNVHSELTSEELDLTILTGDNADSQQFNETRWFIDTLDGTRGNRPPGLPDTIDRNSAPPPPVSPGTPDSIYDGVRDDGDTDSPDGGYYEPDSSEEPREDGDGYSPERLDNVRETGRDVTVRDFPRLFESANEEFEADGLDMPWYSAFGNHDALVQGNSPEAYFGPGGAFPPHVEISNPTYQGIATGCVKVKQLAPPARALIDSLQAEIEALELGGLTPAELEIVRDKTAEVIDLAFDELAEACAGAGQACDRIRGSFDGSATVVPPDPRRCFLAKDEPSAGAPPPCARGSWISEHFLTTGTPAGHGFAPSDPASCRRYADQDGCERALSDDERAAGYGRPPQAVVNHDGYYSFSPAPGVRFVVLDTVSDECGSEFCSEGSVDHLQFEWLRDQIAQATGIRERVVVFSHHTLRTTRQPTTDAGEAPIHYGQRVDRRSNQPQNPATPETLEELFCQNPAVVAHIAGHEHENYVEDHKCNADSPPTPGAGRFVHVSTAAHIDWPQQSRMIELIDNPGPSLSMALTMIDHLGAANPGSEPQGTEQVQKLASIGREISYNDYQGSRGARGAREDRNVVVVMPDPFADG